VKNITFIFETSPNTKPKEKKWVDMAYYIPPHEKVGDTSPVSPTKLPPCVQVIRSTARRYFRGRQHVPAWKYLYPKNKPTKNVRNRGNL